MSYKDYETSRKKAMLEKELKRLAETYLISPIKSPLGLASKGGRANTFKRF